MRIAIDARYLNESFSGLGQYSENLLEHLAQVDQRNEYFVFVHSSFDRRLRLADNFHVIPYPGRPVSLRTLLSFGRRAARLKCDFLHSLSPAAPVLGIRQKILTVHDLQPYAFEEDAPAQRLSLGRRLERMFYRLTFPHFVRDATWLVAVSHATKARLSVLFPEAAQKTIVVHSGVEDVYFQPPEATITQMVWKKLNLPQQYILYVGSARPNKNLPTMLRVFARCLREDPEEFGHLQFLLALGTDFRSPECKRAIAELCLQDNVRILGPITEEEKRVLYHRALLLFSVTRGEGFGLPIVEAQASGVPVLAGDDAAVPEVTGGTALLADPDDEDQIALHLRRLVADENLRNSLAMAGRVNVERFSWLTTARKTLEIYELLM
jgi:glycosyltransferase involved in cell wall biosynthesis